MNIKLGWNSDEESITTCKVTTWCRHILRHYHIHKELKDAAIWTWPISKGHKGQHRTRPKFWCGEYLCKITKRYRQFLQSYRVHKAAWPWACLKVQKGHTKVNVELVWDFYVENIHVKLQHDTGNLWRAIAFTRLRTPPAQATTYFFNAVYWWRDPGLNKQSAQNHDHYRQAFLENTIADCIQKWKK